MSQEEVVFIREKALVRNKIITLLCIGAALFFFYRAFMLSQHNVALNNEINGSLKPSLAQLQESYSDIQQQVATLHESLQEIRAQKATLEEVNQALVQESQDLAVQKRTLLEDIVLNRARPETLRNLNVQMDANAEKFVAMRQQVTDLKKENKALENRFTTMFLEFMKMKKTLSSVEQLRERMVELKKNKKIVKQSKKRKQRVRRKPQRRILVKRHTPDQATGEGNSGYLVRNGKSTYTPSVKIRVLPVEE